MCLTELSLLRGLDPSLPYIDGEHALKEDEIIIQPYLQQAAAGCSTELFPVDCHRDQPTAMCGTLLLAQYIEA